ncbi:alpha-L-fucosidase [Dysgonomonas hofstadii]|uniref:alpha-L-fucosidase n=1 Tax=Dysgonomonas hofstadii TaxID=637886 RepID=A0A840CV59_9BACT|nr:alpha-L-fucosidase [Dysgonomonas hofstadii]MBB4036362.1 alpha-L-fucosidase [Dysgonomonas hofstadii]
MKRISVVAFLLLFIIGFKAQEKGTKLSIDQQHVEWFKDAKFGIFVHWGLYSILGGEYDGTILTPSVDKKKFTHGQTWYAEWIQMRLDIPNSEYHSLAKSFNPTGFDADAWIREVKNAGARYFVITSKHHDGFALWNSKVSSFNIMNTPFKRDVLAELVTACKKYGIKYGFYYSHWQDWEHPQGALPEWKTQRTSEEFEIYWKRKCLPQVKELLDNYDPDLLWFDTWGTEDAHITPQRRDELIALVRANSSKCLINGRIAFSNPGDNIDFMEMLDNAYPSDIQSKPWQTPATMVHSWGWHAHDYNWKTSYRMIEYLINNASKGGNYLLNIGPKPDGTFPVPAIRRLREIGAWVYANNEGVYGTSPVNMKVDKGIYLTQKNVTGKNYLYISIANDQEKISLPIKISEITECRILESGMPISYEVSNISETATSFLIPKSLFEDTAPKVIRLTLKKNL